MRMSVRARIASVLVGAVALLLVAEVFFRGMELLVAREGPAPEDGAFVILATGDSFTYGIGGLSFPQQMDEIFAVERPDLEVRTVNLGVPGVNSVMVADSLPAQLARYGPKAVIVLVGENNSWNSVRLGESAGWWERVDRALLRSRVYKFVRVAMIGWQYNTFHEAAQSRSEARPDQIGDPAEEIGLVFPTGEIAPEIKQEPDVSDEVRERFNALAAMLEAGRYQEAVGPIQDFAESLPGLPHPWNMLGATLLRLDRLEEAEAAYLTGSRQPDSPAHEESWFGAASAARRLGQLERAVDHFEFGLRRFPESRPLYWGLVSVLHTEGKTFEALERVRGIEGVERNEVHQYLAKLAARTPGVHLPVAMRQAFLEDMRRIVRSIEEAGAKPILSSYPDMVYDEVREVAEETGAQFIDFRPYFEERFTHRDEYISADRCHCNTAGYRLMAEVFVEAIMPLLPPPR